MKINKDSRLHPGNTPDFWKKIRNVAGAVALISGVILKALPEGNDDVGGWVKIVFTISTAVAGTAWLTKKDSPVK